MASVRKEIEKKYGECWNMIKYVQKELKTFEEKPFSDEDSVVLAQRSYMHFDAVVPSVSSTLGGISVISMFKAENFPGILHDVRHPDDMVALFSAMAASPRFRSIEVNHPVEVTDTKRDEQFSATTFLLPDGRVYIGFRGTDASLVGWKEDFDMSFEDAVPSQITALKYTEDIAKMSDGKIILGGHSKGGAMALYRAACASDCVRERIEAVYNHDGPGLSKNVMAESHYSEVKPLVHMTIPQQSLIGIIMNDGDYRVVYSVEKGINQHDPFSWQMNKDGFVWADGITRTSDRMEKSLDELMEKLTDEEKKLAVDTAFRVIESTGAESFANWPQSAAKEYRKIIGTLKDIDTETYKAVTRTAVAILKIVFRNMTGIEVSGRVQTVESAFENAVNSVRNQIAERERNHAGEKALSDETEKS